MPTTPDRYPGTREEDELQLIGNVGDPATAGGVKFDGSDFRMRDNAGVFNPRTGGSGLTASQHKALKDLIHFINDGPADGWATGSYKETLPAANPFPTSEVWWTSAAKTHKIVSLDTTWTGVNITSEVWKVYDADGSTVLMTATDTIAYSGVFETSRTRAWA